MNENKMIFADDPEAAVPVTVTAYKSLDGSIWLNEKVARYTSSTHRRCGVDGHEPFRRNAYCGACEAARQENKYQAMPRQPLSWDGGTGYFHDLRADKYFYSEEDVIEHCVMEGIDPQSLHLVHCEALYATVEESPDEQFCDILPEGLEIPEDVAEAWEDLVEALKGCKPVSYRPGGVAVQLSDEFMDDYRKELANIEGGDE